MTPNCRAPGSSRVSPMSGLNLCFRKRGMRELHTRRPEEGTGSEARAGRRDKRFPPESPSSESHKGNWNWFEDEEVVPAFSPPTDSLTSQQLRQSVCTGGGSGRGRLGPSPCRLLQTEGAGPVVVTGQELQRP